MAQPINRDLPLQTRQATFVPTTVDLDRRTVDMVWSTGAAVQRYDWWSGAYYEEILSLDPGAVDLTRMNNGAPLLNAHNACDLDAIMGVIVTGSAKVDGTQGTCTVQFSSRADIEPFFLDVMAGIIRNVSVGYSVQTYEITESPGQMTQYRATAWTPMEISLVPIPADAGAGVRSQPPAARPDKGRAFPCVLNRSNLNQETQMKTPEQIAEEVRVAAEAETTRLAAEAERQRIAAETAKKPPTPGELRTLALALSYRGAEVDAFIVRAIESGKPMDEIRTAEIDAAAEKQRATQPINGVIQLTRDAVETKREGMAEYIRFRGDPGRVKLDKGKEFRGLTLLDLARECLTDAGITVRGMSRLDIATHALNLHLSSGINIRAAGEGISDLPNIVLDAANKTLRQAYMEAPQTFKPFTREGTAPDFKNINRVMMSGAPSLLAVSENGEIQRGYVSDSKETYALTTYARIIPLTRQVIINDDMDALSRIPEAMGRAANRLESDVVWAVITNNLNMADGNPLFSAAHNNLAASGAVISIATLGAMMTAMRKQVGLQKEILNLTPEFLVGPAALDVTLRQITSSAYTPTAQTAVNPYTALKPIVEARLDNNSATAWYGFCGPDQVDTIEYSYLEGQQGVYMETRMGWDVDGMEMKARLDFAAKAIDYRGMYKNPGA
jgi:hypothetical protein